MSLIGNKKAFFNYEITDKFTAGVELFGYEVKSLRKGQGSLDGSYVSIRAGEAYLVGAHIPPFQAGNTPSSYNERRDRKLLLKKKEINSIASGEYGKQARVIPLSIFAAGPKIKVEIGIGQSKKKFDKRESIKKRDTTREMRRDAKNTK